MKSRVFLTLWALVLLFGCHKNAADPLPVAESKAPQPLPGCRQLEDEAMNRRVLARKEPPGSTSLPAVIWLNFEGSLVQGTRWNGATSLHNNDLVCLPAALTEAQKEQVVNRVMEDYAPYQVQVTTSKAEYLAADPLRRTEVIITPTSSWVPDVGGIAYVGSFLWGDDTPASFSVTGWEIM